MRNVTIYAVILITSVDPTTVSSCIAFLSGLEHGTCDDGEKCEINYLAA